MVNVSRENAYVTKASWAINAIRTVALTTVTTMEHVTQMTKEMESVSAPWDTMGKLVKRRTVQTVALDMVFVKLQNALALRVTLEKIVANVAAQQTT
jgi:hypothetical protein